MQWLPAAEPERERLVHLARRLPRTAPPASGCCGAPEHTGSLAANYRFPRWARLDTVLTFSGPAPDKNFSTFPAEDVENDGWSSGTSA